MNVGDILHVKENYKQGCDAVELEIITEEEFNKADNSPPTDKELKQWYNDNV
jgi:hypothetical protein